MDESHGDKVGRYKFSTVTKSGERRKREFQRNILTYLVPTLAPESRVLEIGSGRGEFALECIEAQYDYVGVEPSDELYEGLRAQNIQVVNSVVPPIDFPDASFDLVHSMDLVEHFDSYHVVLEFFDECRRVLKPGAYVSVIAPNYSLLGRLFYEYEYQHSYQTTEDRLAILLADAGFSIVKSSKFLFPWAVKSKWHTLIDRMLANIMVPIGRSYLISGFMKAIFNKEFVFRVHKNLFDHVGLIAQKVDPE